MPRGVPNVKPAEAPEADDEQTEAPEAEASGAIEYRYETFEATRPDGTSVIIERNIDTGEQTVTE